MPASEEPELSLAEWLVLCLIRERSQYGFALARLLGSEGDVGRIWRVPKPVVYRALARLGDLTLVRAPEQQPSRQGAAPPPPPAPPAGRRPAAPPAEKAP